ncbi:cell division control protein 14, SIN component-domain-containing protein [Sparassis latifolia]
MKTLLQDALDELVSTKSPNARVDQALATLERLLAEICVSPTPNALERLYIFIELQDRFDCNVPSRILSWMGGSAAQLEAILSKTISDQERETQSVPFTHQLIQALSILQGVALIHEESKRYLGRRYPLEVLLDLLLTSRHVSFVPPSTSHSTPSSPRSNVSSRNESPNPPSVPLTSAVLDTLLCVLVDSSPALRLFEDLKGVQYVVKILKRAGTPREVRMKCLEFLYFYLLDEIPVSPLNVLSDPRSPAGIAGTPTPSSRAPNRAILSTSHSTTSSVSSTYSSSSSSSGSSVSTSATSVSSLPSTPATSRESSTTPTTPPLPKPAFSRSPRLVTPPPSRALPRSLLMLRREVDYVPQSPKKAPISSLGLGGQRTGEAVKSRLKQRGTVDVLSSEETESDEVHTPRTNRPSHSRGFSVSSHGSHGEPSAIIYTPSGADRNVLGSSRHRRAQSCADVGSLDPPFQLGWSSSSSGSARSAIPSKSGARTMEEKKEILGSMLGNVDALVEGVRKAGIWGLG